MFSWFWNPFRPLKTGKKAITGARFDDSFVLMAERGIQIIDRVVTEEMGGSVDTEKGVWRIPGTGAKVELAKY